MKYTAALLGLCALASPALAQEYDDGRAPIYVSGAERAALLSEMRGFLETVQGTMDAIVTENLVAIAELNAAAGMRAAAATPAALTNKLPEPFRQLGVSTHKLFDGIAQEATDMGDIGAITAQIGGLLANCTACHASYRFEIER